VLRVDEIRDSGKIADQILDSISKSELVLAELSGERPNCYYEAGFAHALGKELIFCIRETDAIHFDLAAHRFIKWGTEADLRRLLQDHLESYTSKGND
jgi:nucleoside 2-deoxyribosyltransferase